MSTLAQVMAWCLMTPSHYMSQCWLLISEVLWHSPDSSFIESAQAAILYKQFDDHTFKISASDWQPTIFLYARLKNGTYYAVAMSVRPSVRLSVRPSVRPSVRVFRTFLQHALRYQFETWYMHSVGGTTCRVWVASQLGQFDLVYSQK